MKKKDLQPGDIIAMEYGFSFCKFMVVQVQDDVLTKMVSLNIIEEIASRKWYFLERPVSLWEKIKKWFI